MGFVWQENQVREKVGEKADGSGEGRTGMRNSSEGIQDYGTSTGVVRLELQRWSDWISRQDRHISWIVAG